MTVDYATYKKTRSDFCAATSAFRVAKRPLTPRLSPYPTDLKDNTQFCYQGFDICIAVEPDDDLETSWLGTFSERRDEDAICHGDRNNNSVAYFNPANTINDHRQWYQKKGYSKHESYTRARSHVLDDYQTLLEIYRNGQALITVTASLKGTKLGTDVLGCCDWDNIEEAIIDNGMVENAVTQAKQTLKALCTAYSLLFQLQEGN